MAHLRLRVYVPASGRLIFVLVPQKATIADVSTEVASLVPICDAKSLLIFTEDGIMCPPHYMASKLLSEDQRLIASPEHPQWVSSGVQHPMPAVSQQSQGTYTGPSVVGSISPAMPTQLALHQSFIPSPQFHAPGSYPVVTPSQPFLNTVVSQCAPTSANAGTGELQAVRAYTSPYTSIASTLQMSGPLEFASPEQHWKPLNSSSRKRKRGGYSSPDMSDHCSCCAHGVKRRYHASDSSATPTSANAHAFTVQASSTLSTESRPRMSPSPVVDVIGIHLSPPKSVPLSPLSMPPTNVRAQTAGSNVNHESTSNSTSSFSDSSSLENDTAAPSKPGSSAKFALTQKKELAKAAGQSKSASIPAATGSSTLSNVPSNQASGVKATGQSKQPPPVVGSASSTSSSEYTSDFTSDDEQTTRTYPVVAKSAAKTVPAKGIVAKGGAAKGNPVKGTPAKGTPAKGTPTTATPAKGTPAKATPAKTAPAKGAPAKGTPANGVPQQKNNSKAATTATSSQASSAKVTVQATQRTDCVSSSESSSDDGVDLTSGDASEYTSNDEPIAAQKVPAKGSSPKALQKTNSKAGAKSDDTSECTSGDTTDYSSDDEPVAAKVPAKGPSPQAQSKTNSKTSAKSGDASEYSSDDEPVAAKKVPAKGPSPQAQSKTNSKTSAKSGDASEYSSDDEPVAAKKVPAKGPSPQAQSKTNSKTSAKSGGASEYSSDDEPVAAKKVPAKGPSPQAQSKTNSKTSAKSGGASEYSSDDEPVAAKKVLAKGSSSKAQQKTKLKAGAKSTKGGKKGSAAAVVASRPGSGKKSASWADSSANFATSALTRRLENISNGKKSVKGVSKIPAPSDISLSHTETRMVSRGAYSMSDVVGDDSLWNTEDEDDCA